MYYDGHIFYQTKEGLCEMARSNSQKNTSVNQITEGVIWKQLLLFFFPIMFGTFFQQLYNTSDALIVGNIVGKHALAAVGGSSSQLINLLVGFFVGLSSGATVILSQFYGARDTEHVHKTVHTAIALSIAGGLLLTFIGIAFCRPALVAMGTPDDILDDSVTYMRIYFLGVIPSLVYNMGSGILRAVGDSKRPLYYLIAACLINIVLDIFFVAVLKLGVAGVGIATSLSQIISAVFVVIALMRSDGDFRLELPEIRFTGPLLADIIRIGLPAGLQQVMYSASNLIVQSSINSFGTDTVAAWTAFGKIDGIFWMIMGAFGVSITTFAGQNFGAGKYDRVRKSTRVCLGMSIGVSIALSVIILAFGEMFFRLFTGDEGVVQIGLKMMHVISPTYATFCFVEIFGGTARGCGDAVRPMLLTCFGVCVLRIAWVIFALPLRHDITTIAFAYPLTWVVTAILFIIYYLSGTWMRGAKKKAEA